jgi:hypothetical protein
MSVPDPLVPAGVDLSGNDWFPFYPSRVRRSRWWRTASDMARARNIMLWGEAWHAVPAGSLPDDDDELAEAAGFGMDTCGFQAVKAEIMAPWVLCSDGRWHHPTVAEMALEAWERMGERRRAQRERQARSREKLRASKSTGSETSPVTPEDAPLAHHEASVTRDSRDVTRDLPAFERDLAIQTDRQTTTAGFSKNPPVEKEPWKGDPECMKLWKMASENARRRSSQKDLWAGWTRARRRLAGAIIIQAYAAYQANDPDYQRTGGPGLHRWLKEKLESWLPARPVAPSERDDDFWRMAMIIFRRDGRWDDSLGPRPGEPGCHVPTNLLLEVAA